MPEDQKDKSEIDLLLIQGKTLYMIEVKAFTDANDSGVKREIVRNYLTLVQIIGNEIFFRNIIETVPAKKNRIFFQEITEIVPILIYSTRYQDKIRGRNSDFNYFNEHFLLKQGTKQDTKIFPSDWLWVYYAKKTQQKKKKKKHDSLISEINEKLLFLTWEDVLKTYHDLNETGKMENVIEKLREKADGFAGKGIGLV
jgi:negative regulator of replication initiation